MARDTGRRLRLTGVGAGVTAIALLANAAPAFADRHPWESAETDGIWSEEYLVRWVPSSGMTVSDTTHDGALRHIYLNINQTKYTGMNWSVDEPAFFELGDTIGPLPGTSSKADQFYYAFCSDGPGNPHCTNTDFLIENPVGPGVPALNHAHVYQFKVAYTVQNNIDEWVAYIRDITSGGNWALAAVASGETCCSTGINAGVEAGQISSTEHYNIPSTDFYGLNYFNADDLNEYVWPQSYTYQNNNMFGNCYWVHDSIRIGADCETGDGTSSSWVTKYTSVLVGGHL